MQYYDLFGLGIHWYSSISRTVCSLEAAEIIESNKADTEVNHIVHRRPVFNN